MAIAVKRASPPEIRGTFLETPMGRLEVVFSPQGVQQVIISPKTDNISPSGQGSWNNWKTEVIQGLRDYFAGRLQNFDHLRLDLQGTPFQLRVWEAVRRVPFGATVSYGELARNLGLRKGARAIGGALRANPLPILIPCHRIISADGSLCGFSASLNRKRWLLDHEQSVRRRGPEELPSVYKETN